MRLSFKVGRYTCKREKRKKEKKEKLKEGSSIGHCGPVAARPFRQEKEGVRGIFFLIE
jgi:hypothetical protein